MAPVLARIASTSVVLPAWCGPTKAIFRRRSTFAIGGSSYAVLTLAAFRRRTFFHGVRRRLARFLCGGFLLNGLCRRLRVRYRAARRFGRGFLSALFCSRFERRLGGRFGRRLFVSGRRGFRLFRRLYGLCCRLGFLSNLSRGGRFCDGLGARRGFWCRGFYGSRFACSRLGCHGLRSGPLRSRFGVRRFCGTFRFCRRL